MPHVQSVVHVLCVAHVQSAGADRDCFCDTLIMLVHEAAEFNSSMEATKQTSNFEFYMAFTVSRFVAKLNVFTKCIYISVPEL